MNVIFLSQYLDIKFASSKSVAQLPVRRPVRCLPVLCVECGSHRNSCFFLVLTNKSVGLCLIVTSLAL